MKTRVLVTGSSSQLGQCIRELFGQGSEVDYIFTDRDSLDISSEEDLRKTFESDNFDYCVNTAAYTAVDKAEEETEEANSINALAVKQLAELCQEFDVVLIHLSTDYVFNGQSDSPYSEDDLTDPVNAYGASKLGGELAIQKTMKDYFIIRTSWLVSDFGSNFLKWVVFMALKNEPMKIVDSQTGRPTSAYDLARFIHHLISTANKVYGIYHFSNSGQTSWDDFARHICELIPGASSDLVSSIFHYPTLADRPDFSVLNLDKTLKIYPEIQSWKMATEEIVRKLLASSQSEM